METQKIIDLVCEAYSTNVFQLSLESIDADSNGSSILKPYEKDGFWILEDKVKFYKQGLDKFSAITFKVEQDRLFAQLDVTLSVDILHADEYDILQVVNKMNLDMQPCSTAYNPETKKIQLGTYLSLVGSPYFFHKDLEADLEYEVQALTNIFSATLAQASDWIDALAVLEKPNATATDVFNHHKNS